MDKKPRILIVDDDQNIRKTLTDILKTLEYAPTTAASVSSALKSVTKNPPAVALLDLKLGEMSGLDLMEEIKRISPRTECIVITGHSTQTSAIEAVNLGAYSYVLKPYNMDELMLTIRRAVEKQEAQVALRESEDLYSGLVETSQDLIWRTNKKGFFTYLNPAWEITHGYLIEEMLGKPFTEFQSKESIEPALQEFSRLMAGGHLRGYETKQISKDGKTIDMVFNAKPIYDENENIIGTQGTAYDITEQKKAVEQLRDSEEKFRNAFDHAGIGRALADPSGRFIQTNEAFCIMSGYDSVELQDLTWEDLTHPDHLAENRKNLGQLLEGKVPSFRMASKLLHKDGENVWVDLNVVLSKDSKGEPQFLVVDIVNVTERVKADEKVRLQLRRLDALHNIDQAITGSLDLRLILNILLDQVMSQLSVDAACIFLIDSLNTLNLTAKKGFDRGQNVSERQFQLGEGFTGQAAYERRIVHISDLGNNEIVKDLGYFTQEEGFVEYYGIPLIAKGEIVGVLEVFNRKELDPDPEWTGFLETLAGQAAIAIFNTELVDNLQRAKLDIEIAYIETLEGWVRALDLRDNATEGHTQRVTTITLRLAKVLQVTSGELVHLRRGALLHDIGKMGIPDSILRKKGPLNEKEWELMRRHPVFAYEMLNKIAYLRPALEIPYCHHEHYDGGGYPRGLKGEDIPMAARIFAIVDVWDALNSDRPYRDRWEEDEIIEHMRQESGKYFDPEIVKVFIRMFENGTLK